MKIKKQHLQKSQFNPPACPLARVEYHKTVITKMLSGSSTRRLNNFDWLRQEISFTEPKTLFFMSSKEQAPYFDHSCTRGLGLAYDYILDKTDKKEFLTIQEMCNIHYLICNEHDVQINETFIRPGVIRKTNIPMEVENELENILYIYRTDNKPAIFRAFDVHYKIIKLQPFDDYNKRTARMIMNWLLLENGYRPIAFTRKSDKISYPESLMDMARGDQKKYYRYMMSAMESSQKKIIDQLKSSRIR